MARKVQNSLYDFINGSVGMIAYDDGGDLVEVVVEGHGRFVLTRAEAGL